MITTFICPHCKKEVEISQALRHQVEEDLRKNLEDSIKKELEEKTATEVKDLKRQLIEKDEKVNELREQELKLREERRKLEEKEKDLKLDLQRQLDEERRKIEEAVLKNALEEHRLKDLEKDKKLQEALEKVKELQTQMQQGSQQTQGEVLELDIEEKLRSTFIYDAIVPIGKGVQGADIIQKVKNQSGKLAGIILWETKRAKWPPSWTPKLKEDGKKNDATMVVLVSENLPKDIEFFKVVDGVLITSITYAIPLANILRRNLMFIAAAKSGSEHKDEKLEMLYEYIQSDAFRHRFEAFADGVKAMEEDLLTERRSMERIWKKRETQLKRMQLNTSRMFGELQGVMDNKLPDIKTLELDSGEE